MAKMKCGNCKWHEDFCGACGNAYSDFCADFTDDDFFCEQYAPRTASVDRKEDEGYAGTCD